LCVDTTVAPTAPIVYTEFTIDIEIKGLESDLFAPANSGTLNVLINTAAKVMGLNLTLPDVSVVVEMPSEKSFNQMEAANHGWHTGKLEDVISRRRLLITQSVTLKVTYSTISFPNSNLLTLYGTFKSALIASVSSGSFISTLNSLCASSCPAVGLNTQVAAIVVSPPSVNGNSPTAAPTQPKPNKDKKSMYVIIWAVFGSLLSLYFLMLVYAASRRYIRRLEKGDKFKPDAGSDAANDDDDDDDGDDKLRYDVDADDLDITLDGEDVKDLDVNLDKINNLKEVFKNKSKKLKFDPQELAEVNDSELDKEFDQLKFVDDK